MVYFVGVKLKDVYNHGVQYVKSHKPDLLDKLTKNFGYVHSLENLAFAYEEASANKQLN